MGEPPPQGPQGHSRLSDLPNELFELVLRHADFPTIAALRTTSKANAARCMSPAFKKYYARQATDLSDASLTRLSLLSTHPQLAPAVTQLTVTTVCYDPIVWERIKHDARRTGGPDFGKKADLINTKVNPQILKLAQRRAAWMQQSDDATATTLARLFTRLSSLTSLRLHTRVVDSIVTETDYWTQSRIREARTRSEMDWISLWTDCSRVLGIVTQAMGRSESTSIQSLSVFDTCFGKVATNRFHETFLPVLRPSNTLHKTFLAATAKLTTLNLAFSPITYTPNSLPDQRGDRLSLRPSLIAANSIALSTEYSTIARFLQSAPRLENLTLYMYNTLQGHPVRYSQVFGRIADDVRLPKLRYLSLRGMWCTPDDTLRFLRAHPDTTVLDFRNFHLMGPLSSWDRIFEFLNWKMHHLSELYLENLWYANGSLLPLNPKDKAYLSTNDLSFQAKNPAQEDIIYARYIKTEELKRGIELAASSATESVSARGRGGVDTLDWIRKRKIEYGPPRCPVGEF